MTEKNERLELADALETTWKFGARPDEAFQAEVLAALRSTASAEPVACSPGTFASVVASRMMGLIETANKASAWEMEAVAEMMKATHLITHAAQPAPSASVRTKENDDAV